VVGRGQLERVEMKTKQKWKIEPDCNAIPGINSWTPIKQPHRLPLYTYYIFNSICKAYSMITTLL